MNHIKLKYTAIAYTRLCTHESEWQPQLGFQSSKDILKKLYHYYQSIYLLQPTKFYWAGLARLTGGQVLYGMSNLVKIAKDPCALTQHMMMAAKDIFDSIAWQHELFMVDTDLLLETCKAIDAIENHTYKYYDCWQNILSNDKVLVAKGNQMLLHNEQLNTIQKHYEEIKKDSYSKKYFWFTSFVMRCIHPYHPRFIFQYPFGDFTIFADRWNWITNKNGMWPSWINISMEEKIRLVSLSNEDVIKHRW